MDALANYSFQTTSEVSGSSGKNISSKKNSNNLSFDSFLSDSTNQGVSKNDNKDISSSTNGNMSIKDNYDKQSALADSKNSTGVTNESTEKIDENMVTDEGNEIADAVEETIDGIKNQLKDALDITDEELNQIMANLNMTPVDLLDVNKVKDLILNAKDNSNIDLLTNENLNSFVNDLLDSITTKIEELLKSANYENLDDLTGFVEKLDMDSNGSILSGLKTDDKNQAYDGINDKKNKLDGGIDIYNEIDKDEKAVFIQESSNSEYAGTNEQGNDSDTTKVDVNVLSDLKTIRKSEVKTSFEQTVVNELNEIVNDKLEASDVSSISSEKSIIDQVVDQIKLVIKEDVKTMELKLYPEHLGKLSIQVASKSGALTASILVESEEAKNAVQANLSTLKEAFNNQNVKVEAVEVSVALENSLQDFGSQSDAKDDQRADKSPKRMNLKELSDTIDELNEEDKIIAEMMVNEGNSINYTA